MKLIHYAKKEFILDSRPYLELDLFPSSKPNGLWVSVQGDNDWEEWCKNEEYGLDHLQVSYEVVLKPNANILKLKTPKQVCNLTKKYPVLRDQWNDIMGKLLCRSYEIDWPKVKSEYQGIIIAPYQWDCRFLQETSWYYGWDCASGCIWDLDCVKEFTLQENYANH